MTAVPGPGPSVPPRRRARSTAPAAPPAVPGSGPAGQPRQAPPPPPVQDPRLVRTATLIELLSDDAVARRLVLSWHLVDHAAPSAQVVRDWAEVAGLGVGDVQRCGRMLGAHEICRGDGTVDPEALRIIGHGAARSTRGGATR